MRESSEVVICAAVATEVLELHVLLLDPGRSVGAQPDIAVRDLSSWRVGAASEAKSTSTDLQVRATECKMQDEAEDEDRDNFHRNKYKINTFPFHHFLGLSSLI